ncbi:MAG: amino acid permease [Candidatus Aenigmatarchaeota archaeon]
MHKLKRVLGLLETTLYGIGVILGVGIYALIGKASGIAGNSVWLSFIIGAIIAIFTGLSYVELSSMFPKAGGEYVYIKNAFNRRLAFLSTWLIILAGALASATMSLGFAGYFSQFYNIPKILIAFSLILFLSIINFIGIKESSKLNIIATAIEVFGLFFIIFSSINYFGNVNYFETSNFGISGIFSAAALIFFAFLGFEDIPRLSEETKNPEKIIPKAIILSIVISTILYVLVSLSVVSVVNYKDLSNSDAPLSFVIKNTLGENLSSLMSIIALFAIFNTVLVTLIATSRIMYGIAKDAEIPKLFSLVHKKFKTPYFSILAICILSLIFVLFEKIEYVAALTDFSLFIVFILVNLSVIILRFKNPNKKRIYKTNIIFALLGALTSIFMLFYIDLEIIIYGIILIFIGIIFYEIKNTSLNINF